MDRFGITATITVPGGNKCDFVLIADSITELSKKINDILPSSIFLASLDHDELRKIIEEEIQKK